MHPAIPIVIMAALISLLREEEKPTPAPEKPKERIVLMPDADGRTGSVVITTPAGATTLDRAFSAADVYATGKVERQEENANAVRERYAAALNARPPAPVSFTLYFLFDKDELTPESIAQFDRIKAELQARPVPEIVVVGHTDRVGAIQYNDALSLKRAEAVRTALGAAGIATAQTEIAGRGEREPAVPTADEVPEPRNRRVEIIVR
jgi:outer membrane protein OmpA-like peptidoglycan-associated protein